MSNDMKARVAPFLGCSLALFIGGCPKRQAPTRIVYVPSPPPAATVAPGAEGAPAMVIEEPAPPEPAVTPPSEAPTDKAPSNKPRRGPRRGPPPADAETSPETTEAPPAPQVPSLEPRESSAEEADLRRQIQGLQDDVRKRMAKLSLAGLSGADRKTLDDARTFFEQSTRALNEADLQRALTLARKASLLVLALER